MPNNSLEFGTRNNQLILGWLPGITRGPGIRNAKLMCTAATRTKFGNRIVVTVSNVKYVFLVLAWSARSATPAIHCWQTHSLL